MVGLCARIALCERPAQRCWMRATLLDRLDAMMVVNDGDKSVLFALDRSMCARALLYCVSATQIVCIQWRGVLHVRPKMPSSRAPMAYRYAATGRGIWSHCCGPGPQRSHSQRS